MKIKKTLFTSCNLSLLIASIIICIVLLELFVRAFIPVSYNYWQYNRDFHHTFINNLDIVRNYWNYSLDFKTDSHGFRSKEFPYQKQKNLNRVLVIGDSITSSVSTPSNKIYTSLLQDYLNTSTSQWEVINRGIEAWSTDIEYLYLTKEGYEYEPNIILLQLSQNDVTDIVVYNITSIKNNTLIVKDWFEPPSVSQKINRYINRYSAAYRIIADFYNNQIKDRNNELNFYINEGYTPDFYTAMKKITMLIEVMNKYAAKKGSLFVVAIYADPRAVNKEYYTFWNKMQKNYLPYQELKKPIILLKDFLVKHKIEYVDTSNSINETTDYISLEDGHLSELGNKKMAELIYKKIVEINKKNNKRKTCVVKTNTKRDTPK